MAPGRQDLLATDWYKVCYNDKSRWFFHPVFTPLIAKEVLSSLLSLKYHPMSQEPYMGIARQLFLIIYFWALLSPPVKRKLFSLKIVLEVV